MSTVCPYLIIIIFVTVVIGGLSQMSAIFSEEGLLCLEICWQTEWQICSETIAQTPPWAQTKSPWWLWHKRRTRLLFQWYSKSCPADKKYSELDSSMMCPSKLWLNFDDSFSAEGYWDRIMFRRDGNVKIMLCSLFFCLSPCLILHHPPHSSLILTFVTNVSVAIVL